MTSLNSVSILTRVIGGFLASKMTAIFIGPSGMALTGSFRVFLTSVDTYSTLGLQSGIIKYTAEYQKDTERLKEVLTTTFLTIIFSILICAGILIIPTAYWSSWVFNDVSYSWVFILLGLTLPLYAGSIVFIAVLSGLGHYKKVIYINIFANLLGVLLSALLIWQLGVDGAFLGLILSPAIVLMLSAYPLIRSLGGLGFIFYPKYFKLSLLKGLGAYSIMSFTTALLGTVIYLTLRNNIVAKGGLAELGYWEGILRISSFYLMFATTMLSVYFLPKLAQAQGDNEVKVIFRSYYKIVVPLFATGLLLVYMLKHFIIRFTLSDAFLPVEKLFIWQLLGDLFKVCSLILGQEFFARKMTKAYIASEIGSFLVLYLSATYLINIYGTEGAVMAHFITYTIYFAVLLVVFRRKVF